MSTVAPAATLRGFYQEIVRPSLVRRQLSKSRLEEFETAVARFEIFCGADIPLEDITEDILTRFETYLFESAIGTNRYRTLRDALRQILSYRSRAPRQNNRFRQPLPEASAGSLRLFFERVYLPHRLAGCAEVSVEQHRGVIHQLFKHYRRDILLRELSDDLASDHSQWILSQGRSAATVNRVLRHWFAVWRYAHELGHCETFPRLKKLPEQESCPDAWSREQLARIFAACKILRNEVICGIPATLYWAGLLRTCYYSALRRRALFALTWEDVDLDEGVLTVPASVMKNRRGQKFHLGNDAVDALRQIEVPRREHLFPRTGSWKQLSQQFHRIVRAASIRKSSSHSPLFHKLRRSVATIIADTKGVAAASELLGHSATFVTRRYVDRSQLKGHDFRDVLTPLPE